MIKKLGLLLAVVFSSISFAQQGTSSPYSFYGLGSLKFKGTVENQSMGGISVYTDSIHMNFRNPASYTSPKLKSFNEESKPVKFTVGGSNVSTDLESQSAVGESQNSTFDYLGITLPVGQFGVGFGLIPFSSVGYKLESRDNDDVLNYKYRGEGGLNKVFLGVGYSLSKHIRLGVDAHYNFGNITNTNIAYGYNEQGELLQYQSREINRSELSGLSFNFGLAYTTMLSEKLELMATATYAPTSDLASNNLRVFSTILENPSTGQEFEINSIEIDLSENNLNSTTQQLPSKTTFGLGFGRPRKWFAGVDYTIQKTSQFSNRFLNIDNASFEDSNTIAVGGFFIPQHTSFSNYWKRVVYRTGFRFENTGLKINDQTIDEFGISFGMGLPVGRVFSNANLGFEYGTRGTTSANLVKEKFFKLMISLSLNDRWFEKRKFN